MSKKFRNGFRALKKDVREKIKSIFKFYKKKYGPHKLISNLNFHKKSSGSKKFTPLTWSLS